MVRKYRNKGIVQAIIAIAITGILVFFIFRLRALPRHERSDGMTAVLLCLYIASWVAWMSASFSLARAKGYSGDLSGGIFLFLIVAGCCFPIAIYLFPFVVLFGLEDKSRERLRRR